MKRQELSEGKLEFIACPDNGFFIKGLSYQHDSVATCEVRRSNGGNDRRKGRAGMTLYTTDDALALAGIHRLEGELKQWRAELLDPDGTESAEECRREIAAREYSQSVMLRCRPALVVAALRQIVEDTENDTG